jgi:pyruvate dehydrogenase E1 component
MTQHYKDPDPQETQEWIESIEDALEEHGYERTRYLLETLIDYAQSKGARLPFNTSTPFVNTILPSQQPDYPGDRDIERKSQYRIARDWWTYFYIRLRCHIIRSCF